MNEQQGSSYPVYFFCARNNTEPERADPDHILRSLMRQSCYLPEERSVHQALKDRYERRRGGCGLSAPDATDLILETTRRRKTTYILVDALDECDRHRRDVLIDCLKSLLENKQSVVKIFVTSRSSHQDIALAMEDYMGLYIDASRNGADIDRYVHHSVEHAITKKRLLPTERRAAKNLQQKIETSLCRGADGM